MRLVILSLMALVVAGCGPQTEDAAKAKAAEEQALKERYQKALQQEHERSERLSKPVLDPKGITPEQAALDHACERRDRLPRATPFAEADAMASTARAKIEGGKLIVGQFSLEAIQDGELGSRYVGRYDRMPVDVVLTYYGDSGGWQILDQEFGALLGFGFLPIPSPDGKTWAAIGAFPAPDGEVAIYERAAKEWTKLAGFPVEDACDVRWADNNTFVFRDNTGLPFSKGLGPNRSIRRVGDEWVIDAPAPGQPLPNQPGTYPSGGFGAVR